MRIYRSRVISARRGGRVKVWRVERPFHRQRQVDTGDVILKVDRRVGGGGGEVRPEGDVGV